MKGKINQSSTSGKFVSDEDFAKLPKNETISQPRKKRAPKIEKLETLEAHKVNTFNKKHIEVHAIDKRQSDGANHRYIVDVLGEKNTEGIYPIIERCVLNFQNGGLKEVGANGITDQALLAIVLHRIEGFQSGQFACEDNQSMITYLRAILARYENRALERATRGVEGERKV